MKLISKLTKSAMVAFLALGIISCNNDDDVTVPTVEANSIADFVSNTSDYSSLAAALDAAGLTATLDGSTNYTIFAPNNAAFSEFLADNGFDSLAEVPVDLLKEVLLNHVQRGVARAASLSTGYYTSMAKGDASDEYLSLYINVGDKVKLNGISTVTNANIEVDNGIIHAVDKVIALPDVTTFILADPNFSSLKSALTREDDYEFVEILQSSGDASPFTVFAPTNDAFAALLTELKVDSLNDIDADLLSSVLSYHVVSGTNLREENLTDGMIVTTFETGEITVDLDDYFILIDENGRTTYLATSEIQANNGVIHVIGTVLLPAAE